MKQHKNRFTAAQFDAALSAEIAYRRSMNIPKNSLSSCVMFTLLVSNRIFGKNRKQAPGLASDIARLVEDAKIERATEEMKAREQAAAQQSRIVLPGKSFN